MSPPPAAESPGGGSRLSVFLSYAHDEPDRGVARRLARKLRRLRLPAATVRPGGPRRLRVFRDRDEGRGGELDDELREAVREATVLVVLCSPDAAGSEYVGREIEWFRSRPTGADDERPRIVPVLVAGDPTVGPGHPRDPFPPALRAALQEPWALDLRPGAPWTRRLADAVGLGRLTPSPGGDRLRSVEPDTVGRVAVKVAATAVDRSPSDVWDPLQPGRRLRAAGLMVGLGALAVLGIMGWRASTLDAYREARATGHPVEALEATRRLRLVDSRASDSLARRVLDDPVPVVEAVVPGAHAGGVFVAGGRSLLWWTEDSLHLGSLDVGRLSAGWSAAATVEPGAVRVAPDGDRVVFLDREGRVRLWEAVEPPVIRSLGSAAALRHVAFGDSGSTVAFLDEVDRLTVLAGGRLEEPLPVAGTGDGIRLGALALAPSGGWVAVGHGGLLRVRDGDGWRAIPVDTVGAVHRVVALDDREVAVSTSWGLAVVEVASGRILARCSAPADLDLAWDPASERLVLADRGAVQHRSRRTPCRVDDVPSRAGHPVEVAELGTGMHGTVSVSRDVAGGVRVWDTESGQPLGGLPSSAPIRAAVPWPDDSRVSTLDDEGVLRVWELCRHRLWHVAGACGTPSPGAGLLDSLRAEQATAAAVGPRRATSEAVDGGWLLRVLDGDRVSWSHPHAWRPWALRWSADGAVLTVLGADARVRRFLASSDSVRVRVDRVLDGSRLP